MLEYGASDCSPSTPPISSLTAHCMQTMLNCDDLLALFKKELDAGWFTEAQLFPAYVPFHVPPAKLVEKELRY